MKRAPIKVNLAARAANAEIRRRRTRARLIDAALAVVADKGLAATIEDFAAAAGVARGTVYNYFPTVADLLDAVRRRILRDVGEGLGVALAQVSDPAAELATLSLFLVAYSQRQPLQGWAALHLERLQPGRRTDGADPFDRILARGVAEGRFRAVDVGAARILAAGAVRMAIHDALTRPAPGEQVVSVCGLILASLGVPPAEALAIAESAARRLAA
ncbi:MAG: TetR/AcrR family transcriptional regulator [Phenylobacterium sp.]|uniref:TetR/AcrR family transcriptional regulator n=1 Tax=Phenylobacterium sp. TaxID=1871053 RepID=UPI003918F5A9